MDEKNRREIIKFEISVSIRTKGCTYDYNDEFLDSTSFLKLITVIYIIIIFMLGFYLNYQHLSKT